MSVQVKESYFWQQVKAGLESDDTHLSRIENTAGTGISDVTACHGGVEAWLELKVMHGNRLYFRNSQKTWIMKRTGVGGRVLIVARKDDDMIVWEGRAVMMSTHIPGTDSKSFSIHKDELPEPLFQCHKPFKWEGVKRAVFGLPH